MIEITREIAEKVRDTVAAGLVSGLGERTPGKMCVEAAVCYALGLPHGDDPGCVAPSLRRLKIALNDSGWSSPTARANGLKRLALAQLGSKGVLDESEFRRRVSEMTIRRVVPVALRAAAKLNPKYRKELEIAAVRCEVEGTCEAALSARDYSASAAAYSASASAAASASVSAAYSASASAAASASASVYAAYSASAASAASAVYASVYVYAADKILSDFAEWVVEILVDMKAPGCKWLKLLDEE